MLEVEIFLCVHSYMEYKFPIIFSPPPPPRLSHAAKLLLQPPNLDIPLTFIYISINYSASGLKSKLFVFSVLWHIVLSISSFTCYKRARFDENVAELLLIPYIQRCFLPPVYISPSPQGATYAHCHIKMHANKYQQSRTATSRSLIMLPN